MSDELLRQFRDDFTFYAPRALRIRAKSGEIQPFTMNAAQHYIHQRVEEQLRTMGRVRANLLKGRQQGASTYIQGRYFHKCSMRRGQSAVILTHLGDSTDALFQMTKRFFDLCPPELRPHAGKSNENELLFDALDSGYIVATAGNRKGIGRGRTFQFFHGSEVAFWDNANEIMAGLGQTVPDLPGTEVIRESTANGVGNSFHQAWQAAERGENDYINIFVPWFWQPEYRRPVLPGFILEPDERAYLDVYAPQGMTLEHMVWRRAKITSDLHGEVALFDQEYPAEPVLAFRRVTGDPLITADLVVRAMKIGLNLVPTGPLIMGVDPAEYGDDSTGIICRQGRRAGALRRLYKHGPMEVVAKVAAIADREKPDAINVDATGIGSGVADRLIELGYPVHRIHFGGKAAKDEQYGIKRDEIWGDMKEWLEDLPNQLPDDDSLASDLCAPQYSYDSSRRLKLESKESMRKRGVKSPDGGDALALTFATPFAGYAGAKGSAQSYKAQRGARRVG